MKELENIKKDQIEEVRQVQAKKTKKLLGLTVPGDGHHLYEFDKATFEMIKVDVADSKNTHYKPKRKLQKGEVYIPHDSAHKAFTIKENCYYVYALNEKNAQKKIIKDLNVPYVIAVQ